MGRRVSSGVVGGSGLGTINVVSSTITTTTTNGDLTLDPNGTGVVRFDSDALFSAQNDLRFADSDSSNWVAFQAPATIAADITWTLPNADGSNGQALVTNGSGTLSWAAAGAALTDNTTDSNTNYLVFTTSTSGNLTAARVSTTKLSFQPSTGTLTVTSIVESSSIVFKENIEPIDNALDLMSQLVGVTYDRKDNKEHEAGLIAEEVYKVAPDLVSLRNGKPYGIKYTKISAYLIESIKSLKKEITELKEKL